MRISCYALITVAGSCCRSTDSGIPAVAASGPRTRAQARREREEEERRKQQPKTTPPTPPVVKKSQAKQTPAKKPRPKKPATKKQPPLPPLPPSPVLPPPPDPPGEQPPAPPGGAPAPYVEDPASSRSSARGSTSPLRPRRLLTSPRSPALARDSWAPELLGRVLGPVNGRGIQPVPAWSIGGTLSQDIQEVQEVPRLRPIQMQMEMQTPIRIRSRIRSRRATMNFGPAQMTSLISRLRKIGTSEGTSSVTGTVTAGIGLSILTS